MTPIGVPSELVFDLPSSMLDSRKIEQRIQPYSQSRYSSAGQVAKFTIPQTDRTLASGQTMYLTGNLEFGGTLGVAGTDTYAILGSFYSMFSRQSVNANGTVLETIERPGELVNCLINMTMNSSEKLAQSNSFGCSHPNIESDATSNISFYINDATAAANNARTVTFAIPIIGVLDTVKYIPMWNSNIELELTVAELSRWLTPILGTGNVANITFELSNLELVFDSIELSPESFSMVMANYPQKVVLKSQSYLYGASTSFRNSGSMDIPVNARLASMKQLITYFNAANCADKTFGGINPNGRDLVFITNGKYHPQRPIKLTNPSEVYMQNQKSFGSIKSYSHSGSIGRAELCRRNVANNWYLETVTSKNDLDNFGNKFYLSIDTEIINTNKSSLYNGVATGVNSTIRVNIDEPLTSDTTCHYWCCYDVLMEMDFLTGITRAIY